MPILVIRRAQIKVFEDHAFKDFRNRVFEHLKRVWPEQVAAYEDSAIHASIERGVQRAASYGITSQRDVVCYIDLMYIHGWDFDGDATMSWAADILENKELSPDTKINRLNTITEKKIGLAP